MVQQNTPGTGTSGFPKDTWTTLQGIWMEKRAVGGQERFTANQTAAKYDTRWIAPWQANLDPDAIDVPKLRRLSYGGRFHDVVAASEIGRREGIELLTLTSTKTV